MKALVDCSVLKSNLCSYGYQNDNFFNMISFNPNNNIVQGHYRLFPDHTADKLTKQKWKRTG